MINQYLFKKHKLEDGKRKIIVIITIDGIQAKL